MLPKKCCRWQRAVSPEKHFKSPSSCRVRALTHGGPFDLLPGEDIPRLEFTTQKELHAFLKSSAAGLLENWDHHDTHLHLFLFGQYASLVLINRPWAVTPDHRVERFDFEERPKRPTVSAQAIQDLFRENPSLTEKTVRSPAYLGSILEETRRLSLLRRLLKSIPGDANVLLETFPEICENLDISVSLATTPSGQQPHRPFYIAQEIATHENQKFLEYLRRLVEKHSATLRISGSSIEERLSDAYVLLEQRRLRAAAVLVHPKLVGSALARCRDLMYQDLPAKYLLWGGDVVPDVEVPENEIWALAEEKTLGGVQELTPLQNMVGYDTKAQGYTQRLRVFLHGRGVVRILLDG